jgi:surfeit locus 1 family protein
MPGLTVVTLICLAILLSLGTWQYKRLHWKTDLIIEIDVAANAEPISNLAQADELFNAGAPLDFRRISLTGQFVKPTTNNGDAFQLLRSTGKSMMWRHYQPFESGGLLAYVATSEFSDSEKKNPPNQFSGEKTIHGYARLVRPMSKFMPESNPTTNSWFVFNGAPETLDWRTAIEGRTIQTGYYIDWVLGTASGNQLAVKKPEIRNNHLDYMLTWYSFALILLVIYLLLHKKQGRLTFGK